MNTEIQASCHARNRFLPSESGSSVEGLEPVTTFYILIYADLQKKFHMLRARLVDWNWLSGDLGGFEELEFDLSLVRKDK